MRDDDTASVALKSAPISGHSTGDFPMDPAAGGEAQPDLTEARANLRALLTSVEDAFESFSEIGEEGGEEDAEYTRAIAALWDRAARRQGASTSGLSRATAAAPCASIADRCSNGEHPWPWPPSALSRPAGTSKPAESPGMTLHPRPPAESDPQRLTPRTIPPEDAERLGLMRDLANQNAHAVIQEFHRKQVAAAQATLGFAVVALLCTAVLLVLARTGSGLAAQLSLVSCIFAGYWGADYMRAVLGLREPSQPTPASTVLDGEARPVSPVISGESGESGGVAPASGPDPA